MLRHMSALESLLENIFDGRWQEAAAADAFVDVEGWDSLRYVQLVVGVEQAFGIELSAEEIERLPSFEGLRSVLAKRGIQA
jgi:acyl carrier protein